ncbi:hypothetical protein [Chitinophaga caeni]|nr:hypothetical protein [Chitinophaga caeni]
MQESNTIFGDDFEEKIVNKRKLLPIWIKIFCWFFLLGGLCEVIIFLGILLGVTPVLAFYGLESQEAFSPTSLLLQSILIIKAIVAFGLLKYKKWAVDLAVLDAIIGIVICLTVSIYRTIQVKFTLEFELLFLVPYLVVMVKRRKNWLLAMKQSTGTL